MTLQATMATIGKLKFLEGLSPAVQSEVVGILARIASPRSVEKGRSWIREHETSPDKGYILLEGSALIHKTGFPDVECQAPELIGEAMQFTAGHERTATVIAATDSVVLRFLWDDFWREIESALPAPDQAKVKEAVEGLAWQHFAQ